MLAIQDIVTAMNRRDFGRASLMGLAGVALPRPRLALAQSSQSGGAYRYVHVDVFTDRRLQGNQLLVFVQPSGLDLDAMQALTRESNYSECTFVFPPEAAGTDHRVRIFTRTAETPFAGHPTLGTAFALAHAGVLKPGMTRTVFGLGVGPTNVDLDWKDGRLAFAWMTQLKPTFGKTITDTAALAAAIGVDASAIGGPHAPQEVNCGSNFFIVPLSSRKAVDAAVLDRAKADAVFAAAGIQRRGMYVFSNERGSDNAIAYTRLLGTGGTEDPGTGSAAGPAACFMVQYRFVPPERAGSIEMLQGVLVKRPCHIHANVSMTGGEVTGVKVGGGAVVVGEGTMSV
jgi:trans-2,3-dihydro-3-hydroxyanthranilate isomerase